MELLWDHFSEEDFRRMKKRVVASTNDDAMTFEAVGSASAGDVRVEIYLCEEADEEFTVQWQYLVGCSGTAADGALRDVREEVPGCPYGAYPALPQRLVYRSDLLYGELRGAIEDALEKAVREDASGLLRAALERPAGRWAFAAPEPDAASAPARPDVRTLEQKIQALADLPAEAFKAAVLSLARGV